MPEEGNTWGELCITTFFCNLCHCKHVDGSLPHDFLWDFLIICSSDLAQSIGINELAESMMAFNTNYKDTGLFGVYAVAKVKILSTCVPSVEKDVV